jgi:hypothetical protein
MASNAGSVSTGIPADPPQPTTNNSPDNATVSFRTAHLHASVAGFILHPARAATQLFLPARAFSDRPFFIHRVSVVLFFQKFTKIFRSIRAT